MTGKNYLALKDLELRLLLVLMTSDCDNDDYPELSREMGADAYCLKSRLQFSIS